MEKRLYDSVLIYSESGAPLSMLLIVLFMINHRPFIREGAKKNREKSGQADRLGRPPLPLPRSGQENVKNSRQVVIFGVILPFYKGQNGSKFSQNASA